MPDFSDETSIRPTTPDEPATTVVRPPAPAPPVSATGETLVRTNTGTAKPIVTSGSAGFAEEMRLLLRKRLLVTHAAVGVVSGLIALLGVLSVAPLPSEAGLGRWAMGLPLLTFGQAVTGLVFLTRRPEAPLSAVRVVEVTHFGAIALFAGIARFLVLYADPAASPDDRYDDLVYRFDAAITNYPIVFAVVLYGALIPNTRRRSLIGTGLLIAVPIAATTLAAVFNPAVRPALPLILPVTAFPLFMAGVVAVFSATRANDLQRETYDALREAKQLGAYTLKRKLGEGGMGEVWLAEHRLLKRPCAMKFIRAELAAEAATAARFEREVRAVTALTHFHTVRIYDYGRSDDGSFYYVMEFLDGPTLDGLVKARGPLPPGRAVYLLRQLCGALAEAHGGGMVHRDLKPNNILIATLGGQRDVAKLLDFGLVQDHSATDSSDRITRAGTVLGTPAFMCPEQAAGEAVDPRGDLYSLGAVAFFMLAGRPPFDGATVGKLISAHLTQPAPDVRQVQPHIPPDLAQVVARCLAKEPGQRFASAAELEAALAACECAKDWSAAEAARWWEPASAAKAETDLDATIVRA